MPERTSSGGCAMWTSSLRPDGSALLDLLSQYPCHQAFDPITGLFRFTADPDRAIVEVDSLADWQRLYECFPGQTGIDVMTMIRTGGIIGIHTTQRGALACHQHAPNPLLPSPLPGTWPTEATYWMFWPLGAGTMEPLSADDPAITYAIAADDSGGMCTVTPAWSLRGLAHPELLDIIERPLRRTYRTRAERVSQSCRAMLPELLSLLVVNGDAPPQTVRGFREWDYPSQLRLFQRTRQHIRQRYTAEVASVQRFIIHGAVRNPHPHGLGVLTMEQIVAQLTPEQQSVYLLQLLSGIVAMTVAQSP